MQTKFLDLTRKFRVIFDAVEEIEAASKVFLVLAKVQVNNLEDLPYSNAAMKC